MNAIVTLGDALIHGPAPVEELLRLGEWQREWALSRGNRYPEADAHLAIARGKLLARSGATTAAEAASRDAVELARGTENLNLHGRALLDLGEVLRLTARPNEAVAATERAMQAFEQKGNIAAAAQARETLDAWQPAMRL